MVLHDAPLEVLEKACGPLERYGDLRDEHGVDVCRRQRGVARDEPRVTTHQLDDTYPVIDARRLDMRPANDVDGRREGGLEAEAAVDEMDVVVDRLGDPDDGDGQATPLDLGHELDRGAQSPIAAEHKQHADPERVEAVDHFPCIALAARTAERRASLVVDRRDGGWGQGDRLEAVAPEAMEPVPKAEHVLDAVPAIKLENDATHDVVEARAQAPARDDGAPELGCVEVDAIARAGQLEGWGARRVARRVREAVVEQHAVSLADIVHPHTRQPHGQRGGVPTRAEDFILEV